MTNYDYFTRAEAKEKILDYLEDNPNSNPDTAFDQTFNEDYYIIGRAEAEEALEHSPWGIFSAISIIKEYEEDKDGNLFTDVSEPEMVANMLEYIVGEDIWQEIKDKFKEETKIDIDDYTLSQMDDDVQNKLIKFIKHYKVTEDAYINTYLD